MDTPFSILFLLDSLLCIDFNNATPVYKQIFVYLQLPTLFEYNRMSMLNLVASLVKVTS